MGPSFSRQWGSTGVDKPWSTWKCESRNRSSHLGTAGTDRPSADPPPGSRSTQEAPPESHQGHREPHGPGEREGAATRTPSTPRQAQVAWGTTTHPPLNTQSPSRPRAPHPPTHLHPNHPPSPEKGTGPTPPGKPEAGAERPTAGVATSPPPSVRQPGAGQGEPKPGPNASPEGESGRGGRSQRRKRGRAPHTSRTTPQGRAAHPRPPPRDAPRPPTRTEPPHTANPHQSHGTHQASRSSHHSPPRATAPARTRPARTGTTPSHPPQVPGGPQPEQAGCWSTLTAP